MVSRSDHKVTYHQVVGHVLDLADPIYDSGSTDEIANVAASQIGEYVQSLVDAAVRRETENLRDALQAMITNHYRKFRINGKCPCGACATAIKLLGNSN